MEPSTLQHDLHYNVLLGIRYHMYRQAFFERWHRLTGVLSLSFSSAAIATIVADISNPLGTTLAAIVAIAQAFDMMFETNKRAIIHADLKRRYTILEPKLIPAVELSTDDCIAMKQEVAAIEIEEPPIKKTLMNYTQNEVLDILGYSEEDEDNKGAFTKLRWPKTAFPNFFS